MGDLEACKQAAGKKDETPEAGRANMAHTCAPLKSQEAVSLSFDPADHSAFKFVAPCVYNTCWQTYVKETH